MIAFQLFLYFLQLFFQILDITEDIVKDFSDRIRTVIEGILFQIGNNSLVGFDQLAGRQFTFSGEYF